jgi:hypothetical protein
MGIARLRPGVFHGSPMTCVATKGTEGRMGKKVSCEDCYFRCNLLCALDEAKPCATFRPNHPEGLRPPQQLRFTFRQERRTRAAWQFPSAQEQAALHR